MRTFETRGCLLLLSCALGAFGCDRSSDKGDADSAKQEPAVASAAVGKAAESKPAEPKPADTKQAEPPEDAPTETSPPPKAKPEEPETSRALIAVFEGDPATLVVRDISDAKAEPLLRKPLEARAVARRWAEGHGLVVMHDKPLGLITVRGGTVTKQPLPARVKWDHEHRTLEQLADGSVALRECAEWSEDLPDAPFECLETRDIELLPAPAGGTGAKAAPPLTEAPPKGYALKITEVSDTELMLECRSPSGAAALSSKGREGAWMSGSAQWLTAAPGLFLLERELDFMEAQEYETHLMRACEPEPLSKDPELLWGPDDLWAFGERERWSIRQGVEERMVLKRSSWGRLAPTFVGPSLLAP